MTDHKFTDEEVIKALELCNEGEDDACVLCPYAHTPNCYNESGKDALDLINRQKAEIERLSDRNKKCIYLSDDETTEYCVDSICPNFKSEEQIRAEAIKEFSERLHKHIDDFREKREMVMLLYTEAALLYIEKEIDDLAKEMTGG